MKKTFFLQILALLALLSACDLNIDSPDNPKDVDPTAVGFNVYVNRGLQTKAGWGGMLTLDDLKDGTKANGFGVFAYYGNGALYNETSKPDFMYDQQVTQHNEQRVGIQPRQILAERVRRSGLERSGRPPDVLCLRTIRGGNPFHGRGNGRRDDRHHRDVAEHLRRRSGGDVQLQPDAGCRRRPLLGRGRRCVHVFGRRRQQQRGSGLSFPQRDQAQDGRPSEIRVQPRPGAVERADRCGHRRSCRRRKDEDLCPFGDLQRLLHARFPELEQQYDGRPYLVRHLGHRQTEERAGDGL